MTETQAHDYTRRRWGHNYEITKIIDGGMTLKISGWGRGISKGDFIILPNGAETTRYQIASIEYHMNPTDMWNATATFAPRARLARNVAQAAQ